MNALSVALLALILAVLVLFLYYAFLRKGKRFSEDDRTYYNAEGEHLYYDRKLIRQKQTRRTHED